MVGVVALDSTSNCTKFLNPRPFKIQVVFYQKKNFNLSNHMTTHVIQNTKIVSWLKTFITTLLFLGYFRFFLDADQSTRQVTEIPETS